MTTAARKRDTSTLVYALALSVAAPGSKAMFLTSNNRADGSASLEDAAGSGRPFMVEVADQVLAVDCDDASQTGPMFRALLGLHGALVDASLRPVRVASGGGAGRAHLFVRVDDRHALESYAAQAKEAGLDLRRGASRIRPPLVAHRRGTSSTLISPSDPIAALDSLRPKPVRQTLSDRIQRLLVFGDERGRYESRSEVVQAIVTGAAQAGWSEDEALEALLEAEHNGGERVREIASRSGLSGAHAYVHRSWGKALVRVVSSPFVSGYEVTLAATSKLRSVAGSKRWPGLAGASERAVLEALIGIAEQACSLEFTASVRQVAEGAGLLEKATHGALGRLQPDWVIRLISGHGRRASRWRLNGTKGQEDSTNPHTPLAVSGNEVDLSAFAHDAFRHRGLGKNGARVWSALLSERGQSAIELSKQLCLHRKTVTRRLEQLRKVGLAVQSVCLSKQRLEQLRKVGLAVQDGGHWFLLQRDLADVARDIGTFGTGDRQQARNVEDRERYLWSLNPRSPLLGVRGHTIDGATGEIIRHKSGVT